MKHFLKQKFYGKLLSFLKYKRHKKIRTFLSFSKKKNDLFVNLNYNSKTNNFSSPYFLKKSDLDSFHVDSKSTLFQQNLQQKKDYQEESVFHRIDKKKYKLNSFLFNMLCQYSRGRLNSLLGQEILFRYYTIPYRLSLSRFIGNKVLRSYYKNLSKKSLLNLRKKITLKAKRSNLDKKEILKQFLFLLENRLDSSLLRLLQFKPLYTKKYVLDNNLDVFNLENNLFYEKKQENLNQKKNTWYKIKSPWKNYSVLQMKQYVKHGHVLLNGKKVKSSNIQLNLYDQITLKGFISNPFFNNSLNKSIFEKKQILKTFFFRNSTHLLTDFISFNTKYSKNFNDNSNILEYFFSVSNKTSLPQIPQNDILLLCDFIKNLKIKRFTEIFFLTYKNFFLLSDSSIFSKVSSSERFNNIKFFFQTLGYNQSIYFLWPLISLLTIQSWNGISKNAIIHSATNLKRIDSQKNRSSISDHASKDKSVFLNSSLIQKNLKDLLNLKNYQVKLSLSKQNVNTDSLSNSFLDNSNTKLLNNIMLKNKPNISWLFNKSNLDNCYASIIYGTRKCKWVLLQQQKNSGFYNKVYNKINFFELELDFFQLAYRHYKFN